MVVLAPLAVGMGVAKAGAGILGAIGQHQSATAQARAQNEAAKRRYQLAIRRQQRDWTFTTGKYANDLNQYRQQLSNNTVAAQRAFNAEDLKMSNLFKSQAVQQQAMAIQAAGAAGALAAKGKKGRSARRSDQNVLSSWARNLGMQQTNLNQGRVGLSIRNDRTRDQLAAANQRAYASVAMAPMKPVALEAPQQVSGPSQMSLFTNIGGALLDGASDMFSVNKALS